MNVVTKSEQKVMSEKQEMQSERNMLVNTTDEVKEKQLGKNADEVKKPMKQSWKKKV